MGERKEGEREGRRKAGREGGREGGRRELTDRGKTPAYTRTCK